MGRKTRTTVLSQAIQDNQCHVDSNGVMTIPPTDEEYNRQFVCERLINMGIATSVGSRSYVNIEVPVVGKGCIIRYGDGVSYTSADIDWEIHGPRRKIDDFLYACRDAKPIYVPFLAGLKFTNKHKSLYLWQEQNGNVVSLKHSYTDIDQPQPVVATKSEATISRTQAKQEIVRILVDELQVAVRPRNTLTTVRFDTANLINTPRDGALHQVVGNGWVAYGDAAAITNLWTWCSNRGEVEVSHLVGLQFSRGCNKLEIITQSDGSLNFEYTKGSVRYNLADVTNMVKSSLLEPSEVPMSGSLSLITMKRGALLKALEERIAQLDKEHNKKVKKRARDLTAALKDGTSVEMFVKEVGRDGEWYWMHQKLEVVKASCDKKFEIASGDIARIMAAPSAHVLRD